MDVKTLLNIGYQKVKNRNDVRDLLAYIMGSTFEQLLMNYDELVEDELVDKYNHLLEKLAKGYPLAYIKGVRSFCGRDFFVSESVLIPREETERIIDIIKEEHFENVLDLCTGSGVIGITLELDTNKKVVLSDVSDKAIEVAKNNAKALKSNVEIVLSDLFERIDDKYDIIVSNPPYIKREELEKLPLLKSEPYIALVGGEDGLYFYDKILKEAKDYLKTNGKIIFEIGSDQMEDVRELSIKYGYKVDKEYKDVYGLDRFIKLSK